MLAITVHVDLYLRETQSRLQARHKTVIVVFPFSSFLPVGVESSEGDLNCRDSEEDQSAREVGEDRNKERGSC